MRVEPRYSATGRLPANRAASSARERTSSFRYTRVSVTSTVFTLRWSVGRDLLVRASLGNELGDPLLALGELVRITDAASRDPPELAAD